jgi:hypothetical protein
MTTTTFAVAVQQGSEILYAQKTADIGWGALFVEVSAERRDEAVAEAKAAGLPYEVVELAATLVDGGPGRTFAAPRRIEGSAALVRGKVVR